jgi:hypothetical protein
MRFSHQLLEERKLKIPVPSNKLKQWEAHDTDEVVGRSKVLKSLQPV